MPSVLIVGASRGIGLGLAQQYAGAGWDVYATTRSAERDALPLPDDVHVLTGLDVARGEDISRFGRAIAPVALDVVIHNAGVHERAHSVEYVMHVNARAPFNIVDVILPNLVRGQQRKLVLISSQLGARRGRTGSLGVYGDSKAALNDTFRQRAPSWAAMGITGIVLHPGWVRTDMGGSTAPVSVDASAAGIGRVVEDLTPAHAGTFRTWEGAEHPW
ncbi:MAG: SDR family NAD(P)-dependent oxidoreductase [Gammaproteobacteria bacterium]|nr:SDR family NAD(P)-dependent oxidoreductase [Gammaproteobacteria bacterium]